MSPNGSKLKCIRCKMERFRRYGQAETISKLHMHVKFSMMAEGKELKKMKEDASVLVGVPVIPPQLLGESLGWM